MKKDRREDAMDRADQIVNKIDGLLGGSANPDDALSADAMNWSPGATDDGSRLEVLTSMEELFGPPIDVYTRADMIADGSLVPVPEGIAREAGFTVPVALTAATWADCVAWCDAYAERTGAIQDQDGRLWDVLTMTRAAARRAPNGSSRTLVQLHVVPNDAPFTDETDPPLVELVAVIGPGDDCGPVMTIMRPLEED
jgi:hypothetical protein